MIRARFMVVEHASARGVAERWKYHYCDKAGAWKPLMGASSSLIYDKLVALGDAPDIAEVADVIGNKSWSYLRCTSCGAEVAHLVRFTESWDTEVRLCRTCISEAAVVAQELPA